MRQYCLYKSLFSNLFLFEYCLISSLPPLLHVVGRPLYARPSLLHPVGAERVNVVSERSPRWRKNDDTGEDEERERRRSERQGNRGAALTRSSSPSTTRLTHFTPHVVTIVNREVNVSNEVRRGVDEETHRATPHRSLLPEGRVTVCRSYLTPSGSPPSGRRPARCAA